MSDANKKDDEKVETLSDSAIQLDDDEGEDPPRPSEADRDSEPDLEGPIESHLPPWLGSGLFWILAAVAMVASFGVLFVKHRNVFEATALVPVLTITGPSRAAAGETVRYAVLVRDKQGAPIASAPVRLGFYKRGFIELGRATTTEGGEATIGIKLPDDFAEPRTVVGVAEVGVAEGYDSVPLEPKKLGLGSMFVSTDKPMYQPSQTIHIRALAMAGDKPMGARHAIVEVRTADGIKVFREEKPTTDFGVVSADFPLAEQVKLGLYTITVTIKANTSDKDKEAQPNVVGSRQVEVKRYSLPKLKVALEDVSPIGVEGLKGKAHATWIFGEPVVRGKVTLEVIGWTHAATSRVEGVTDKNGVFAFDFPWRTDIKTQNRQRGTFTLKAKVAVEGGMANETSTPITTLDGGDLRLEAFAEGGALLEDIDQDVFVVVSSREAQETVTVRTLDAAPGTGAKVSGRGIAKVRVRAAKPLKPSDPPAKLTLVAEGDRGSEGKLEITPVRSQLLVRSDRDAYNAGDVAKVTVVGAVTGDRIAARLTKGSEPVALGSCLVVDAARGCEVLLPIAKETAGLVWLHAMSLPVGRRVPGTDGVMPASDVLTGKRLAIVLGGGRDLGIKAIPDKPTFAPRETGVVDVAISSPSTGAPVKAQLGVTVADEAIFALADVRPDLEKIFFTIDKDLEATRRQTSYPYAYRGSFGGARYSGGEQRLPAGLESSAAYDPATEPDVRSAILAVLTTMPEAGASSVASSGELSARAAQAARDRGKRIAGWAIVLVGIWALIAFGGFAVFGWSRLRHAQTPPATPEDAESFKIETRALCIDWLIACLAPIGLMAGIVAANAGLGFSRTPHEGALLGAWLVSAGFFAVMLVRALLRVRRTAIARRAPPLVRMLVFLPVAAFLGHLAVVLSLVDEGNRLVYIFGGSGKGGVFIVPTAITLLAQITCGFLSIARQTLLRSVSIKGRVWLFLSRASFVGLPLTLAFAVFLVYEWRRVAARSTWHDFVELSQERDYRDRGGDGDFADQKEGGTGTRAKGEEGSMGNPFGRPGAGGGSAAAPSAARFALTGGDEEKSAGAISVGKPVVRTRDYFPETLLWAPEVITDDRGHAKINVAFADSITTWRFGLRAVSKEGQLGSLTIPLVVKQDFFVDAHLPPVLTQGDEVAMPVTVYSYLPEEQDVGIEIEGDGVTAVGGQRNTLHFAPKEVRGFRFTIRADRAGDRTVRIKATGKTRGDALERKIKVIPNGLQVVRTINGRLVESASEDIDLPPNGVDGGNDLYMKIYGGPLSQVSEGLDGVFTMPHGCFEQTSSVTYPSILALDFLQRSKTVSPEIEKRAKQYILDGYQQLISFEVSTNGGFSLFGKSPASTILSAYGLLELSDMSRVTPFVDDMILRRTRTWLYNNRSKEGGWAKVAPTVDPSYLSAPSKPAKPDPDDELVTAYVAWSLATAAAVMPGDKDDKLASVLDGVVKMKGAKAEDVYGLALRANALIAAGRTADARPLLERLAASAVKGDDGVHWTSTETGVMYSAGESMNVEVTGLASHALSRAEMHPDLRSGALSWLVSRRNYSGVWSTTQATIAAMRALLAEAKPAPKEPQDVTITVDGEAAGTLRLEPGGRDVHHLVNLKKWSAAGRHQVEARATGAADVGFQLVTQHYLPWQRQAPGKPSPLTMEVSYAPQAVQTGTETICRVHVTWKGKEPARMPLIEIGVPPAFEVDPADLDKLISSQDAQVKRYGIERGKVTLYLDVLAEDQPLTLNLPMRALRPARVVVPSSSAYLYYEPEVHSDTQPVVVRAL